MTFFTAMWPTFRPTVLWGVGKVLINKEENGGANGDRTRFNGKPRHDTPLFTAFFGVSWFIVARFLSQFKRSIA